MSSATSNEAAHAAPSVNPSPVFKSILDHLASCGSPVDDLVLCILDGLPPSYRQFCSSIRIRTRTTTLSLEELHTLLICEELAIADDTQTDSSNVTMVIRPPKAHSNRGAMSFRGRGYYPNRGNQTPRRPFYSAEGRINSSSNPTHTNVRP